MNLAKKKKKLSPQTAEKEAEIRLQEFLDMISPSTIKFYTDYFICGNTYRSVWAIREYPTETAELGILRHLGEKDGVTLKIYTRWVSPSEERKIISNAASRNRLKKSDTSDIKETIEAESNLQDVYTLVAQMHRDKEPLIHTAVYVEIMTFTLETLRQLQSVVEAELIRSNLNVDKLLLRQQQGFASSMPVGYNAFGVQFERVLPASSVANLYPFNYSGKTDPKGIYIGKDKCGSNILVDFNKRADDKTNANILILGNSGQGKSFLMKLLLQNLRQSGLKICCLDPENEYLDLTRELGGCYLNMMSGEYIINVLEPKLWQTETLNDIKTKENDTGVVPDAFKKNSRLSQHISFLKDFFREYKDFKDVHLDTLEILISKLYDNFNMTDDCKFEALKPTDYPILSDLYALAELEFKNTKDGEKNLYTEKTLQEICLGLHSLCVGSESKFFNGHTNVTSDHFITFGVRGLIDANKNIKNAMLFNILAYMSNLLLTEGNAVASIDELYLFLTNLTAIEYIRNLSKRVRKKNSSVILASQNVEDFNLPSIAEYTKPLFSIPTHQFLFYPGTINPKIYMESLQLEQSEFELIRYSQNGVCLYKCGNERYNLKVIAPEYKQALFGSAGGK